MNKRTPKSEVYSDTAQEYCHCGMRIKESIHKFNFSRHHDLYWDKTTDFVIKIFKCDNCLSVTIILYSYSTTEAYREYLDNKRDSMSDLELQEAEVHTELGASDEIFNPLYYRQVLYAPKKGRHPAIPEPIVDILNEANSVKAQSPRACFILCRAVLEEICDSFKISRSAVTNKGKEYFLSLHDRLSQLVKNEGLSEELNDIVTSLRRLGNEGAHSKHRDFQEKVAEEEAETFLELTDYILGKLYVERHTAQEVEKTLEKLKKKVLTNKTESGDNQDQQ
jgi:hypothetical protein